MNKIDKKAKQYALVIVILFICIWSCESTKVSKCPLTWTVCNYSDTPFTRYNAFIRYQMPWFPGGGTIIARVLDRIPEDSMKVWIGKKTWDSLENLR